MSKAVLKCIWLSRICRQVLVLSAELIVSGSTSKGRQVLILSRELIVSGSTSKGRLVLILSAKLILSVNNGEGMLVLILSRRLIVSGSDGEGRLVLILSRAHILSERIHGSIGIGRLVLRQLSSEVLLISIICSELTRLILVKLRKRVRISCPRVSMTSLLVF